MIEDVAGYVSYSIGIITISLICNAFCYFLFLRQWKIACRIYLMFLQWLKLQFLLRRGICKNRKCVQYFGLKRFICRYHSEEWSNYLHKADFLWRRFYLLINSKYLSVKVLLIPYSYEISLQLFTKFRQWYIFCF
jgi:hypothetical protein